MAQPTAQTVFTPHTIQANRDDQADTRLAGLRRLLAGQCG